MKRSGRHTFPAYHPKRDRKAIARLARAQLWRCSDFRDTKAAEKAFNRLAWYYHIWRKSLVVQGCSLDELKQVFCDEYENNRRAVERQRRLLNSIGIFVCALIILLIVLMMLLNLPHRVIQ